MLLFDEDEVQAFLQNALGEGYKVEIGYYYLGWDFTFVIFRNGKELAFIDYDSPPDMSQSASLSYPVYLLDGKDQYYAIVTEDNDYYLFPSSNDRPTKLSAEQFVETLLSVLRVVYPIPERESVIKLFQGFALDNNLKPVYDYLEGKGESLFCDTKKGELYFASFEDEDTFFMKLLPQNSGIRRVCRYTTINNAFILINKQQQNMCNILCMNDKSEGFYADRIVYGQRTGVCNDAYSESDRCYILSMLSESNEDNLTMWRLYGDDARGACLTYTIEANTDGASNPERSFFLSKVSYGSINKDTGLEVHKELEFLKNIYQYEFENGWKFVFRRWGIWKHFFKSVHFKDEHEVRLLYLDQNDNREPFVWIKNDYSQIVTKMQLFGLNDFPLRIDGIRIGPKVSEAEVVRRQLSHMAESKHMMITVDASKIGIYR